MMLMGYYLVKYEGLNFDRFLDYVIRQNVDIWDLKKVSAKEIYFKVSAFNYKHILSKHTQKWYNICIVQKYGLAKLKSTLIRRVGLVVGLSCVIILSAIFSKTTFNYSITGLNTISQQQVEDLLENYGIKKGKINNFNNDDLEQYLLEKLPKISLVSVMVKGNTLSINIKEKEESLNTYLPVITSPYTMLITGINVTSGTLAVKVGDVVKKGSVLVYPYVLNTDGSKTKCKAVASIQGDIWFCGNVDFKEKEEVLVRTGRKTTKRTTYFGKYPLLTKNPNVSFEFYEVESRQSQTKNFFLPFSTKTQVYYECKYKTVTRSLEKEKEGLFKQSKQNAYATLPAGFNVVEETQQIIKVDNIYKIQTYLKCNVEITNDN